MRCVAPKVIRNGLRRSRIMREGGHTLTKGWIRTAQSETQNKDAFMRKKHATKGVRASFSFLPPRFCTVFVT